MARELTNAVVGLIVDNVIDFLRDHELSEPHPAQMSRLEEALLTRYDSCEIGVNSSNPHGVFKLYLHTTIDDGWRIDLFNSNGRRSQVLSEVLQLYVEAGIRGDQFILNATYLVGIGPHNACKFVRLVTDYGPQKVNAGTAEEREEHLIAVAGPDYFHGSEYRRFWAEVQVLENQAILASFCTQPKLMLT